MTPSRRGRLLRAGSGAQGAGLLAAGLVLTVAATGPHGIALLAWFAPVPWLRFLRRHPGRGPALAFAATLLLATGVQAHGAGAAAAGVGALLVAGHLAWLASTRHGPPGLAVLAYPLWMLLAFAAAWLALPQAAAHATPWAGVPAQEARLLGGVLGAPLALGLVLWVAAALAGLWGTVHPVSMRRHLASAALATLAALGFGALRAADGGPTAAAAGLAGLSDPGAWAGAAAFAATALVLLSVRDHLDRRAARQRRLAQALDPW